MHYVFVSCKKKYASTGGVFLLFSKCLWHFRPDEQTPLIGRLGSTYLLMKHMQSVLMLRIIQPFNDMSFGWKSCNFASFTQYFHHIKTMGG